jgi:hypothetical protein
MSEIRRLKSASAATNELKDDGWEGPPDDSWLEYTSAE